MHSPHSLLPQQVIPQKNLVDLIGLTLDSREAQFQSVYPAAATYRPPDSQHKRPQLLSILKQRSDIVVQLQENLLIKAWKVRHTQEAIKAG